MYTICAVLHPFIFEDTVLYHATSLQPEKYLSAFHIVGGSADDLLIFLFSENVTLLFLKDICIDMKFQVGNSFLSTLQICHFAVF